MKQLGLLVLLVLSASILPIAKSQDSIPMPTDCSAETVKSVLETVKTAVDAALADTTAEPSAGAMILEDVKNYIGILRSLCDNLSFAGTADTVTDLVTFPAGTYRATFTTDGYGSVIETTVDNGMCGAGTSFLQSALFIVTKGNAAEGAQAIFTAKSDCTGIIEVKNVQGEWSLTFERLTN